MKGTSHDKRRHNRAEGLIPAAQLAAGSNTAAVVARLPETRAALAARLESLHLRVAGFETFESANAWLRHQVALSLIVIDGTFPHLEISQFCQGIASVLPGNGGQVPVGLVLGVLPPVAAQVITQGLGVTAVLPRIDESNAFEQAIAALMPGRSDPPRARLLVASTTIPEDGLRQALSLQWELNWAHTAAEALRLAAAWQPEFLLVDAALDGAPQSALLEALRGAVPQAMCAAVSLGPEIPAPQGATWFSGPFTPGKTPVWADQMWRRHLALEWLEFAQLQQRETAALEIRAQALREVMPGGFALFEAMPGDPGSADDFRCVEINPAGETLTGFPRERIVGRPLAELIAEGFHPLSAVFQDADDTGKTVSYERFQPKTGRHLEGKAFSPLPGLFAIAFIDVTSRKQAEARYLRAQRMECIGSLTSGVAHDLNNILAAIAMAATMLKEHPQGPDVPTLMKTISSSAGRGAAIVKQLLTFGRGTEVERLEIQPKIVLEEIAQLARDTFPKDIEVTCDYPSDLWNMQANATQMHQVLLNLCINARDAMPGGGKISLSASNRHLGRHFTERHPGAEPGAYVAIKIHDSGTGMPPEVASKIFEPYFTTKEPGKGTGLGLPTVLDIVKSHRGCLTLDTKPGHGTEFTVYFPALDPAAVAKARSAIKIEQTALLVESDPSARDYLRQTLETHGYRVLVSRNGPHAIDLHDRHQGEIGIVLTDLTTLSPHQEIVARVIRNNNAEVPMVVVGATPGYEKTARMLGLNPQGFLLKPFQAAAIAQVLNDLSAA